MNGMKRLKIRLQAYCHNVVVEQLDLLLGRSEANPSLPHYRIR